VAVFFPRACLVSRWRPPCRRRPRRRRRGLRRATDPGDLSVLDADRAVAHQPEGTIVGHGGDCRIGQEQLEHARPCCVSTDTILSPAGCEIDPMPIKWEIFHDQKLVHIIANGRVTLPEMEEHFDALAVEPIACVVFEPATFSTAAGVGRMIVDTAPRSPATRQFAHVAQNISGRTTGRVEGTVKVRMAALFRNLRVRIRTAAAVADGRLLQPES
jgi:hypothetical protein